MTKLTIQQSNTEDKKPAVKHSVGQYYLNEESGNVYLLARTSTDCVVLAGLDNGNRYADERFVENAFNISQAEWENITFRDEGQFVLLSAVSVTYTK